MQVYHGTNAALGIIHGGADGITGVADTMRGHHKLDKRRMGAGVLQATIGACACIPNSYFIRWSESEWENLEHLPKVLTYCGLITTEKGEHRDD